MSNIIKCCECQYSIYVKHDPFTGKERYHCGNGVFETDAYGNKWLVSDKGCEFGVVKPLDKPM